MGKQLLNRHENGFVNRRINRFMNGFVNSVRWEIKKRFRKMRPVLIPLLAVFLLICILPPGICRYLDQHVRLLVSVVNIFLIGCLTLAVFAVPFGGLIYVYDEFYDLESSSDISAGTRLFTRLLVNVSLGCAVYGIGAAASAAMEKFAAEDHSWFQMDMAFEQYLLWLLPCSLCFLFCFLQSYSVSLEKHYGLPAIGSGCLLGVLQGMLDTKEEWRESLMLSSGLWNAGWILLIFAICGFFFLKCVRMEEKGLG